MSPPSKASAGFSFVAQARSWLPGPIGGVQWWGVDDTYSTVYFPMYCGATEVPHSFEVGNGDFQHVTWDSGFWVFNQVSNYAYLRYSEMILDIRKLQGQLEGQYIAEVPEIDSAALDLYERSPKLARDYLTDYSTATGDALVERWRELSKFLLYKYLDGNLKNEHGDVEHPGYPEEWYKMVAEATGDHLKMGQLEVERVAAAKKKENTAKLAASVLTLLDARGIDIDDESRTKIMTCENPSELKTWLLNAATAWCW